MKLSCDMPASVIHLIHLRVNHVSVFLFVCLFVCFVWVGFLLLLLSVCLRISCLGGGGKNVSFILNFNSYNCDTFIFNVLFLFNVLCQYHGLTANIRYNIRAGMSLNIYSFIHSFICILAHLIIVKY